MFGLNQPFDLQRVPWSRRQSMFVVYEDFENHDLYLTHVRTMVFQAMRKNLFRIQPVLGGKILPYTYFADFSHVRIDTDSGSAELCMDGIDQLRLRGSGIGLRLTCDAPGEELLGVADKGDGSVELSFGLAGKSLFLPLIGAMKTTVEYGEDGAPSRVAFDFSPDENGRFELAVHEYMQNRVRDAYYRPFEELRRDAEISFEDFTKNYRPAAPGLETTARYAQYMIWTHMQGREGQHGLFRQPMVYMHRLWLAMAFSWQQSYNAMSMLNNPDEGWRLLTSFLDFQHVSGLLPAAVSYNEANTHSCQPAIQGFALSHILDNLGDAHITPERAEAAYAPFCKWTRYWLDYHGTGVPDHLHYYNLNESGWDDATVFRKGTPCATPDIYAMVSLLCELCGKLAAVTGRKSEADEWYAQAKRLVDVLVAEHWDGEKFIPIMTKTGEKVENMSIAGYQPIILGKRLPQHIIDKIAETVMREDEFLTDIGLTAESLKSPDISFSNQYFVLGKVLAPVQMFLTVGLKRAGKDAEAKEIARRWCAKIRERGFILGFAPLPTEVDGSPYPDPDLPSAGDTWTWASWTAVCFLILSTYVLNS
ncbi:MAG: hypothetical protein LBN99_06005 [Oscillospiraceae bacterium]|jgi:hypothetical protein|nr:hypothetical protein [Oscillospiraceae bacterium]